MKALLSVLITSCLLGIALGAAVAYVEVPPTNGLVVESEEFSTKIADAEPDNHAHAVAEVPETVFEFGNIERGTSMSHEFLIRNVGEEPLHVDVESTTCKCTVGDLSDNKVEPGDTTKVLLEWVAKTPPGPFRHGAVLGTNDPHQRSINLTVEGQVVESTAMYPAELYFGTLRSGETKQVSLHLMQFLDEEIEVLDYQVGDEQLAEQVEIEITEATAEELPSPEAIAGRKVTATYKSDKVIGPFQGWVELKTNLKNAETLSVPIFGNVVGDVSIFHPAWQEKKGLMRMGTFASKEGKRVVLTVAVRGEHGEGTRLEVAQVDPPALIATLGEPKQMGAKLKHVPLELEVPPGTTPIVRLGEPISSDAHVLLKSTDGTIPDVRLRVQFAVE